MGNKRKKEYTEEEIRRKIQKLTEKLPKPTNRTADEIILPESEHNSNNSVLDTSYDWSLYCESFMADTVQFEPPMQSPDIPRPDSPQPNQLPQPVTSEQPGPSSPLPGPSVDKEVASTEELELGEDILQLLGDAPKEETPLGPSIHKDIARRWQDILAKGLSKEVKDSIYKDYLVPNNCDLLLTPTLNPEVKAALPDVLVKRDMSLAYKQKQLGIALSALSNVMEMLVANETSKQKLLKRLSDACRLLCDSHQTDTKTRRGFVLSAINANLKDVLIETKRDKLLFGENVADKLKAAKAIQQSGNALKNTQKPKFNRPNIASAPTNKGRLNYVPQHRKMDNKMNDRRRASNLPQRQHQSSHVRRQSDRPLPVKSQNANRN